MHVSSPELRLSMYIILSSFCHSESSQCTQTNQINACFSELLICTHIYKTTFRHNKSLCLYACKEARPNFLFINGKWKPYEKDKTSYFARVMQSSVRLHKYISSDFFGGYYCNEVKSSQWTFIKSIKNHNYVQDDLELDHLNQCNPLLFFWDIQLWGDFMWQEAFTLCILFMCISQQTSNWMTRFQFLMILYT